ncbi:hypothetical protein [Okeania sp.]|uniref:hypothetical protein n=1 Tax=Okeania sp. TaxID=3100323 RepID=UPI002B4B8408|nr:hypothetical protein [Okeania sp.]MEB3343261.1 hypothetical protein [Okeania sp.]
MIKKVYAPNVHLFAFHLKESDRPNLLWDKCNTILSRKFGLTQPLEIEEQIGYRVDLLKHKTEDDVALHFESQVFLDGTQLPITGVAAPIRIHDTYTLALNIRRPELDENGKKTNPLNPNFLKLLNPSGCLMPTEIGSSLGQTLLLTVWYTQEKQWLPRKSLQNRQKLRELADNCLRGFIPNEYSCPDFYRESQLFGSPIFEYGVPTQGKDYCHVVVWIFCETETDRKFTHYYSSFVNLFCYLNKVVTAYKLSRQVHDVLRKEYLAIESYIQEIFQGMPVDKKLTEKELNQFKKYLKEIPQKYLSYNQFTRELDNYRLTIDINAQNYKREINDIQSQLPGENLSFLSQFFDEDYRLFREQLQSDLGYFQHGATLLEKAMTAIQGRVDIEQTESDRSFQNTIAIMGVGLTSGAVGATVAPYIIAQEPEKPLLPDFHLHPLTQTLFLSLFFGVMGAGFTVIIQKIMALRGIKKL